MLQSIAWGATDKEGLGSDACWRTAIPLGYTKVVNGLNFTYPRYGIGIPDCPCREFRHPIDRNSEEKGDTKRRRESDE